MGIEVRLGWFVTDVSDRGVTLRTGREDHESVAARTVLWAAGVLASPLGRLVAEQVGARVDPAGRVVVEADLSLSGHPNIFVIGDLAHVETPDGLLVPGIAPVAMSEGAFVARAIQRRAGGHQPGAFRYKDRGKMAAIGRGAAVADLGRLRLSGSIGWLAWLGVHLLALARFENRLLVFTQWAWSYWTRGRSARILSARPRERP
jgi:NADH dehydrogenase